MARPDSPQTAALRQRFSYHERPDIVLACAFEESEGGYRKHAFYDRIGDVARSLHKSIFLPHRDIPADWSAHKLFTVTNEIVIPAADVMLCYAGLPSTDGGVMVQNAARHCVPIICFYEHGTLDLPRCSLEERIVFSSEEEALSRLRSSLTSFYDKEPLLRAKTDGRTQ